MSVKWTLQYQIMQDKPIVQPLGGRLRNTAAKPLMAEMRRFPLDLTVKEREDLQRAADERGVNVKSLVKSGYEKEIARVPLLGAIPCSPAQSLDDMVYAPENQERVNVGDLFPVRNGRCYFVEAKGESMTGDGILPGDWVLIEKTESNDVPIFYASDVWVVLIFQEMAGWEVTLKRVARGSTEKEIVLRPMNADFEDIIVPSDPDRLRFCGIMRGLVRRS